MMSDVKLLLLLYITNMKQLGIFIVLKCHVYMVVTFHEALRYIVEMKRYDHDHNIKMQNVFLEQFMYNDTFMAKLVQYCVHNQINNVIYL